MQAIKGRVEAKEITKKIKSLYRIYKMDRQSTRRTRPRERQQPANNYSVSNFLSSLYSGIGNVYSTTVDAFNHAYAQHQAGVPQEQWTLLQDLGLVSRATSTEQRDQRRRRRRRRRQQRERQNEFSEDEMIREAQEEVREEVEDELAENYFDPPANYNIEQTRREHIRYDGMHQATNEGFAHYYSQRVVAQAA